ncbi:MAG: putative metal-dependent hydrolase [Acidobacteria bacterium]|nr:putative metal-dependent hydrolase [Acidobacteriota bacterium]
MSTQPVDAALEALRYPIGRFKRPETVTLTDRETAIGALAELPENLRHALEDLDDEQLDTPYRDGGWTVRALTHHIADSHMTAFSRIRFALTEDAPTVKAYSEDAWAKLHDSQAAPAIWSVQLLEALHARWVMLLQGLSDAEWQRTFVHPERPHPLTIETSVLIYAWHSRHHVAHITHLRERNGW